VEGTAIRRDLEGALEQVEGWLGPDEALALYEVVRRLPEGPVTVVEIGSWKGRSTIALGLAVKARGSGRVFAIDPHNGENGSGPLEPGSIARPTLDEFHTNIARAGIEPSVETVVSASQAARSRFADQSLDFLFVDGSHRYADVRSDIEDWASALKDDAVIAFNDPSDPGVYRALRELVLRPGPFVCPRLIHNTLFFDFRRPVLWQNQDTKSLRKMRLLLWLKFHAAPLWPWIPGWLVRVARRLSGLMMGLPRLRVRNVP
jgi:predicted O-methyltransferase YrrM